MDCLRPFQGEDFILHNKSRIIKGIFASILAVTVALPGCTKKEVNPSATQSSSASTDEILIGEVGSLSGNDATFGTSTRDGVDLATQQVNAAGGLLGRKVRVIVMDDQGKPEEAATAVTKLISQNKVIAILGEVASTRSLAMAPIAQQNKIPMISPSSTNPEVTKKGDFVFRVCFIDPFQGSVMAKFAANTLKAKKAAILKDVKNDYSMGLAKYFIETFKGLGGEILVEQSYSANDTDFKSQLTAIKGKNPDVIFVPGYYTEVGLIGLQAKEIGIKAPMLGGDGWDSSKLREIGGSSLDGSFFSTHYSADDPSPHVQKFISEFKTNYNGTPDALAAMGYDAALVLFDAIRKAKSLAGPDLRDAISQTKDFQGVTGKITIDKDHNAVKSAAVLEVKNGGNFVFKQNVAPTAAAN